MSQSVSSKCYADYALNGDLAGKVYVVTGSATGFGEALARTLLSHKATVILADKNKGALEALYDDVADTDGEAILYPVNFESATYDDYQSLASHIREEFGCLDGVIHNAAITGPLSPLEHVDIKQWFSQLQVNLNVPFILHQALTPLLNESDNGIEAFITDDIGRRHAAYWGGYGASKAALMSLMQTAADETENKGTVKIFAIDPGPINTASRRKLYPGKNPTDWPTPHERTHLLLAAIGEARSEVHGKVLMPFTQ